MGRSTTSVKLQTTRKAAFVGLDYHKKFTHVSIGDEFGHEIHSQRIPNDKQAVREFFARYPEVVCAIESCRGYEWLLDFLTEELNLTVKLANVHRMKIITQCKSKADRIDARALMQMLAIGFLPECYQPTKLERRIRERLRWRAHLVRYATRMKVRIYALLDKENLGLQIKDPFSCQGRAELEEVELTNGRQEILNEHITLLEQFEFLVKRENRWVSQEIKDIPDAERLTTIPGIGQLTALLLWAEMGDISRFRNSAQVASYFGLVPTVKASAERRCYGPITKQGSKFVRWMLVQCAWHAIRQPGQFREHYNQVKIRVGTNGAIVAVARKLVKIAYRIVRDQKNFQAELVSKQEAA
jgi:transposase